MFYQIYVRSFADGNGDGVGDLAGIRSRLPYLADLGVDALWITPFYPSPMHDHGYDVADPRDVEPLFGDLAGFDVLLAVIGPLVALHRSPAVVSPPVPAEDAQGDPAHVASACGPEGRSMS